MELESIAKLSKDVKKAAAELGPDEARFLVDLYYQMQDQRIRNDGQSRSMYKDREPNATFQHFGGIFEQTERQCKNVLEKYAMAHPVGQWLLSVHGIGPVLAAGLLAYIDIEKAPTVGHIWAYAGMDPKRQWIGREKSKKLVTDLVKQDLPLDDIARLVAAEVGMRYENFMMQINKDEGKLTRATIEAVGARRPWNNQLKVLCWKIGQSFVKMSAAKCPYRVIYDQRKAYELKNNGEGLYAEQAASILATKNIGKDTDAYKAYSIGQLPGAHINARVERYVVKQFLADLHSVWYFAHYGKEPPLPYAIAILGHAHLRKVGEAA